jgi:spore coat polysaccharide biosynthesis protein SpsF
LIPLDFLQMEDGQNQLNSFNPIMKIVATIEARMSSSRLPGKILMDVLGEPMLARMIERVKQSRLLDQLVVATTDHPSDDVVEDLCKKSDVGCFRGSESNVLERVLRAAKAFNADWIVELTGDCPLIDPVLIDLVIERFKAREKSFDYISNALEVTYPRGQDVQVFPTAILEDVNRRTQDPLDREHVSLYIYTHTELYRCHNIEAAPQHRRQDLRMTVDVQEDLDVVRKIYKNLYPKNESFTLSDIIRFLDDSPQISRLNKTVKQSPLDASQRTRQSH